MIESIGLRCFRCFGSSRFSLPLRGFTALYGCNGSGRTSLIESVRFLKRTDGSSCRMTAGGSSTGWMILGRRGSF